MAQTKLTAKEIGDLKGRLEAERVELRDQLATIEEEAFAATQSELSGDVGLDDESADAGHGDVRAREGPLDREQRA